MASSNRDNSNNSNSNNDNPDNVLNIRDKRRLIIAPDADKQIEDQMKEELPDLSKFSVYIVYAVLPDFPWVGNSGKMETAGGHMGRMSTPLDTPMEPIFAAPQGQWEMLQRECKIYCVKCTVCQPSALSGGVIVCSVHAQLENNPAIVLMRSFCATDENWAQVQEMTKSYHNNYPREQFKQFGE